jgi:hypothetical protein
VRKATVTALFLFAVLSLVLTYPLALHLSGAVEDRQDALLNVWITAWDGHQLLADPLHLFDANIFSPYPRTLAYSELLLGNALLALPVTAIAHNPVLGYNVALLLSFFLTALGAYLLVLTLTRSPGAGMAAGIIFAFSSYRMTNLAQAQLLTTQWLPFALLAWCQLMRRPRARYAIILTLFFCLQALSSFYYGILLALALLVLTMLELAPAILSRPTPHTSHITHHASRTTHHASRIASLALAGAGSLLLILPFALPYFQVQHQLGFERSLADSEPFSASLAQYAMAPAGSLLYGRLLPADDTPLAGGYPVDALFPGLVALVLGLWGVVRGRGRSRWSFLVLLAAAWILSLGPRLYLAPGKPAGLGVSLPYAWLYAVVPGFKAMRAPARFDILLALALAVLAGYGVAALRRAALPSRLVRPAVIPVLVSAVILESVVWPAAHAEPVPVGDAVPPVYRWLAHAEGERPTTILELPMAFTPGGPQLEYQVLSTYHWSTTPDGYSGFIPPKHGQIVYEMERFSSERSVSMLQALGVRYVVIHTDRYEPDRWREVEQALDETDEIVPAASFDPDRVYEVSPRMFEPSSLDVRAYLPAEVAAGHPYTAYVIVVNRADRSYAVPPTDLLHTDVRWTLDGQVVVSGDALADVPLVTSPEGGAAVIPVSVAAPVAPGTYQLAIGEESGLFGSWEAEGTIRVLDGAAAPGSEGFPVPAQLAGWSLPAEARPGQTLKTDLEWRALGKIDAYYSIYVKLLDGQGNALASWDGQPRNGAASTLLWVPGQTIDDTVELAVPSGTPPGTYSVEVGMYRAEDLVPCLTLDAAGVPVERVVLGTVEVVP